MMTARSWLFVPGDAPRKMEKALGSGADALILDLEDAVAPAGKAAAREAVADLLSRERPMPCFVRVNALGTGLTDDDVRSVGRPDGYVLPKCEGPQDIARLAALTGEAPILAIATETVRAVRSLLTDDWTHPALCGLAWGTEDLSADLGASESRGRDGALHTPFLFARDAMLFAAKAAGVAAIDQVHTDFRNTDALSIEAAEAEAIGFTGKLAIHPAQIDPIHAAFTPSKDRIAWARQVVAAMEEAGEGVASLDGRMLDRPHLLQAQAILDRAPRDQET